MYVCDLYVRLFIFIVLCSVYINFFVSPKMHKKCTVVKKSEMTNWTIKLNFDGNAPELLLQMQWLSYVA